jgi:hypothetical protein
MRRIISALGVAAAILLAGCSSDFPTTLAVAQGTTVTDAGLTMTVTNTSLRKTLPPYLPWGPWLVVKLHVSNGGDKPALFDPMFQELFIDGRRYDPDPLAADAADDTMVSGASLIPGSQANVAVAFLAYKPVSPDFAIYNAGPLEKKKLQLALRGDLNSPGAVINLTVNHSDWQ